MKVKLLFAWYDFWVGLFWDSKKNWLYILPLPMIGIIIKFPYRRYWLISTTKGMRGAICGSTVKSQLEYEKRVNKHDFIPYWAHTETGEPIFGYPKNYKP